jgi:RNA-directed DNA polymerase
MAAATCRRRDIVVRYADDTVVGFQLRSDAERFLDELRQRLQKFGLELHPQKTRIIEFGRLAARKRKARNLGKPETFAFLGFTHICGRVGQGPSSSCGTPFVNGCGRSSGR